MTSKNLPDTTPLEAKLEEFEAEADLFARRGLEGHAGLIRSMVEDIRHAIRLERERTDPVAKVAAAYGYSPSYVHQMVRDGVIPDVSEDEDGTRLVRYTDVGALRTRMKEPIVHTIEVAPHAKPPTRRRTHMNVRILSAS